MKRDKFLRKIGQCKQDSLNQFLKKTLSPNVIALPAWNDTFIYGLELAVYVTVFKAVQFSEDMREYLLLEEAIMCSSTLKFKTFMVLEKSPIGV